jgi:hypothetical protein
MKDTTGLKKGRKKGSLNLVTQTTKQVIAEILENNLHTIQEDLEQLKPYERIKVMLELMQYTTAKLKAIEVTEPTNRNFTPVIIDMTNWK